MENGPVVTALLEKRSEIARAISELERQVRKHKADMAQLDATIEMFAPSIIAAKRDATRFARSAHFVVGELTRRCNQALREFEGRPFSADSLAIDVMREKDLDPGDGELRADIAKRLLWTLNRMLRRGAVQKIGYGQDAKWALPRADQDRLLVEMMS